MTSELWRPVPGFADRYEVSTHGRVRSLQYRGNPRDEPKVLVPAPIDDQGHLQVHLWKEGRHQLLVHRLVLGAFIGPCPEGHEASHLNGDPGDNRLDNLAWETREQNMARRRVHNDQREQGQASLAEVDP